MRSGNRNATSSRLDTDMWGVLDLVALQFCVLIFQPLSTDARRINVTAHGRLPCLTWTIAWSSGVRVGDQ
jgi:hypothetical protein